MPAALPFVPWHMWGTSAVVTVPHPSSSLTQFQQTQQLARVNYARPDSWTFFFGARLLSGPAGVGSGVDLIVDFDLILGLGRSVWNWPSSIPGEPGFARLVKHWAAATPAPVGALIWTTAVQSPLDDRNPAAPVIITPLDCFPAQDIQCSARVSVQAASAEDLPAQVEVHAYFAPRNHIRPEWYTDHHGDESRFRGAEQGGS